MSNIYALKLNKFNDLKEYVEYVLNGSLFQTTNNVYAFWLDTFQLYFSFRSTEYRLQSIWRDEHVEFCNLLIQDQLGLATRLGQLWNAASISK